MKKLVLRICVCALLVQTAFGWDYEAHRLINQLALASLPKDFPAFAFTAEARERITFLSGEPDRWRNTPDLELRHANGPDHYISLEELPRYDLTPETLPPLRYDFVAQIARSRGAHPERFLPIDPNRDTDHTWELCGFLPWTMAEYYAKLKTEFSYLKTFQERGGTPEEIDNAQANIVYTMGVMGHFYGDATQPLHTTIHFNGWVGYNPHHYTTDRAFHAWIDGGYIVKANISDDLADMKKKIRPAQLVTYDGQPAPPEQIFPAVVAFIVEQNKMVEPLYKLDREHKLTGDDELGMQGVPFIEGQLVKAGQFLGDMWYTAWQQAPMNEYRDRDEGGINPHRRRQNNY